MKVRVRAAGMAARHLPGRPAGGKVEVTVPADATVQTLIEALRLPAERNWLTSLNSNIVTRDDWPQAALHDGDDVAILPPIKGG